MQTADSERDFTHEREVLKILTGAIASSRETSGDLIDRRLSMWRTLDELGVPRKSIAEWSGVTAMIVTRALNGENENVG